MNSHGLLNAFSDPRNIEFRNGKSYFSDVQEFQSKRAWNTMKMNQNSEDKLSGQAFLLVFTWFAERVFRLA